MADVKKLIKAELKKSTIAEKKNVTIRVDVELADRYAALKDAYSAANGGQKLDLPLLVQLTFTELVEAIEEEIQSAIEKGKKGKGLGTKDEQIELDGVSK